MATIVLNCILLLQYFVWPPLLRTSASMRLGMYSCSSWRYLIGTLLHISSMRFQSSCMFFGVFLYLSSWYLLYDQTCSMRLMSGELAGHLRISLAVCTLVLTC